MQSVRIDRGRVIPVMFCVIGTVLLFALYQFLYIKLSSTPFAIAGILISPILPILWTSRAIMEINPHKKRAIRYIWLMGRKFNVTPSESTYTDLLLEGKFSESSSYGTRSDGIKTYFLTGYLRLANDQRIRLVSDPDPKFVTKRMEKFAKKLEVTLTRDVQEE